ncbi:MAG: hypothetical protein D6701_01130 [Gemmatimonadetes bacterium]|nr:MAG: hypothetical protein D6701_01130 [Gemmatimonadota bacterium]
MLRERARAAGVPAGRVSVAAECTRCDDRFYSHRRGDAGRQVAVLGVRV